MSDALCLLRSDAIMLNEMNYKQAENFILTFTNYEESAAVAYNTSNYDLRRMQLLIHMLGNFQQSKNTIHIAGTKGKGSTAAMVANILQGAKYRTGLFTSPHLYTWRERIKFNGRLISKLDFARLATLLEPVVREINTQAQFGKLTTFEVLTAMALVYFNAKQADFQVIETGMGGRLDATNIVNPRICIITSISLDHTQILGETLEEIAVEKVGIIKPGCTVISAPQSPEVTTIIEQKCKGLGLSLIQAGKDITWQRIGGDLSGQHFKLTSRTGEYDLFIPLLGDYQLENAALAVAAIEKLCQDGISIKYKDAVAGLRTVYWPARFQILQRSPLIIIDGAHNPYSLKRVIESINKYFSFNRAFVIFGSSNDKDIAGMAKELSNFASEIVLTISGHPRAAKISELVQRFNQAGVEASSATDLRSAIADFISLAEKNDLILVTGSLFLAAEAATIFKKANKKYQQTQITDARCRNALNG